MAITKIEEINKSDLVDFSKLQTLVCKYKPDTRDILVIAAITKDSNETYFEGVILYSAIRPKDQFATMQFERNHFEYFHDVIKLKNNE